MNEGLSTSALKTSTGSESSSVSDLKLASSYPNVEVQYSIAQYSTIDISIFFKAPSLQ